MNSLYTINFEYKTPGNKAFALRFCGDFIGYYDSHSEAYNEAMARQVRDEYATVISQFMDVLWIKKDGIYRVIYGADISDFKDIEQAAVRFVSCVNHSLQCNKG